MSIKKAIYNERTGLYERIKEKPTKRLLASFKSWSLISKALVLAAAMRIYQIGRAAFWYDEGVTAVLSNLSWQKMIAATAGDVHPPGYYIIVWLMGRVITINELTARLPSVILSVLVVYLAYILAKRMELNKRGQIAAITWVIISPLQLHYAQEARMYSLLQALVLLAIILLIDNRKTFLSIVIAAILYTHNYGAFYGATLALAALWQEIHKLREYHPVIEIREVLPIAIKEFIRSWLPWFVVPVLAWLPWLAVMLRQMKTISGGYWIQPVSIPNIIFVSYQLLFAYSMPTTFQGLGVLLTCGLVIYMAWRIYKNRPRYYQLLLIVIGTPLALAVIMSIAWRPLLLFRGLIGTAIPLVILVIKCIEEIKIDYKKYYAYAMIAATLLAGVTGHYLYNAENKGMTTTWVDGISAEFQNGDVILSLNDNGIIAAMTYAPDLPLYKLTGCGQEPLGSLSQATRTALGVKEKNIPGLLEIMSHNNTTEKYARVWFISTVAPVSPACEVAAAAEIINSQEYNVILVEELANTEYTQAGVYLITSKRIY